MMVPGPNGAATKIYLSKKINTKANQLLLSKTIKFSV